ncbi:SDR family NAD(P)-dependent oxidoreductase [Pseudofrankia inefficax]|uniref:Short-chain dehydrogenase/reductase SDR n=1 Tax=Pseudofrankia inefficax (strain DSM 45817 / CECT 9037 / DDB 130130 / EuI1c) TaxID=298654 RepID=E3JD70_PSEI1|nr:SDR family oxidoreductase [Pseudofrankia inefficax]ADP82354.1 short-chain dehydrogenase/reductase SDR [Pseudofrankia inefficax]
MKLGLEGRTAVVTGASRGIGLAVARALVGEGATVVAGARGGSPELDELAAGGNLTPVRVDLSSPDGPARLVAAAGERVDILVNNVGSAPTRLAGFAAITDEMWQQTWELNVMAAVRASRAVLPAMLAAGGGSIVTISSVNSTLADPLVMDYSAAKAALSSFCKALSKEVGPKGVRVNTISPGPVATDLWLGADGVAAHLSAAQGATASDIVDSAAAGMLTGRFTRPDEIAAAVLLLASDASANMTGADIRIDGGMITTW